MNLAYKALSKEPVMLGAAVLVTTDGVAVLAHASTMTQGILHGIAALWIGWGVRILSTPESRAKARVEEAKYVGAVEHQALASLQPKATRARTAKKA